MQPSPELRKQTSAVYNQAPSSSGEEVINKLPTWNCRRNPAGCMQGSIWARGRKFKWVVVVQKIPLGAPMDTAPGQNVRVFILNLSLWQNNALSWLATLLLTQTNHYKPNPPTHLSRSILWSQGYVDKFCWNQADICQSNRHFPGIKHQEELCWLQVWKEPCGACACLPFGVQGEAGSPAGARWHQVSDLEIRLNSHQIYFWIVLFISRSHTPGLRIWTTSFKKTSLPACWGRNSVMGACHSQMHIPPL